MEIDSVTVGLQPNLEQSEDSLLQKALGAIKKIGKPTMLATGLVLAPLAAEAVIDADEAGADHCYDGQDHIVGRGGEPDCPLPKHLGSTEDPEPTSPPPTAAPAPRPTAAPATAAPRPRAVVTTNPPTTAATTTTTAPTTTTTLAPTTLPPTTEAPPTTTNTSMVEMIGSDTTNQMVGHPVAEQQNVSEKNDSNNNDAIPLGLGALAAAGVAVFAGYRLRHRGNNKRQGPPIAKPA